jgi:spermidine/putrescine transport system ATP-binding protein
MELINLKDVSKKYKNGVNAIYDLDLKIRKGEFVFIIGGSGSGKSNLIKMLYREEKPTKGEINIAGVNVAKLWNSRVYKLRRRLGIVFQDYRLLPKLTVYENVAFALEAIGEKKSEIRVKTLRAIELVGLKSKIRQYPDQLSGGEQQRVAIARAIVNEPKVLLLDEPLGALDLKLRQDMQYELIRLKNELGITFIYVTHDQEEALTMSDHIVVMNQGYIQQEGSPEKIYNEPENAFVADFIGDSNIIHATMVQDKLVRILGANFTCVDTGFGVNTPVDVVIRPEDVELVPRGKGTLPGKVSHVIFKGVHYEMEVEAGGFEWLVHSTRMAQVGDEVDISVDPFNIQVMNVPASEDEEAIEIDV